MEVTITGREKGGKGMRGGFSNFDRITAYAQYNKHDLRRVVWILIFQMSSGRKVWEPRMIYWLKFPRTVEARSVFIRRLWPYKKFDLNGNLL